MQTDKIIHIYIKMSFAAAHYLQGTQFTLLSPLEISFCFPPLCFYALSSHLIPPYFPSFRASRKGWLLPLTTPSFVIMPIGIRQRGLAGFSLSFWSPPYPDMESRISWDPAKPRTARFLLLSLNIVKANVGLEPSTDVRFGIQLRCHFCCNMP